MMGLLAALLAALVRRLQLAPLRQRWRSGSASAALLMLALLPAVSHAQSPPAPAPVVANDASAWPSQDLLDQLRQRLTEAPKCAPGCAELAQARLSVTGHQLDVLLQADAGAALALPLPMVDDALRLVQVKLDGRPTDALVRDSGSVLLRLERGVHQVDLRYAIGAGDTATLRFALPPRRIGFSGEGWQLDGIDDGRVLGDSVTLNRAAPAQAGLVKTAQSFPPYIRVTRRLLLGVDWQVENTARRIAPQEGGFSTEVPLLRGEHPLGENARVSDGRIGITFRADEETVRWQSRLDKVDTLALTAPPLAERAEVWEVNASPMWHVQARGVPTSPTARDADGTGRRFLPLPGEQLQLTITRPPASAGSSLAFDAVIVRSSAGDRLMQTQLDLTARSTRGGEHAIALPAGAELIDARRDGESISLAVRNSQLSLPLLPGTHRFELQLRQNAGVGTRTRTPAFALRAPAANIELQLTLPHDRWVLWTWGPSIGPAVLYWSQLLVLLIAAWLLARFAPTPLRFHHWLLLGLGFSAFAWSAYALVVLWLIALGWRARGAAAERFGSVRFNVLQIGLAVLTGLALLVLVAAVPKGLLGLPDMHVAGNGSSGWLLRWFADRTADALPRAGALSLPLWVYKVAMLAWALWLANALIGWLRWGFDAWTRGGYWKPRAPKPTATAPQLPSTPEPGAIEHD